MSRSKVLGMVGALSLASVLLTGCAPLSPEEVDAQAERIAATVLARPPQATPAAAALDEQAQSAATVQPEGAVDPALDLNGRPIAVAMLGPYPPFSIPGDSDAAGTGLDHDVLQAVCELLNCAPEITEMDWDEFFGAASSPYDLMAGGLIITPERQKEWEFSIPYFQIGRAIVVRVGRAGLLDQASLAENDAILGAMAWDERAMTDLVGRQAAQTFWDYSEAVEALSAGTVDALILDEIMANSLAADHPDEITVVGEPLAYWDEVAFAFPKGSELVEPVNRAIQALQQDGTLDGLRARWMDGG